MIEPKPERTLLHYRLLNILGEGAMGVVYKAEDMRLGRVVALKFLPKNLSSPEAFQRFLREARAAAQINHPNVCTIFDIHDSGDERFIAMEFVEGMTLRRDVDELMKSGGLLAIEVVLQRGIGIGQALAAAHERGIIHRDVKSENIMVDATGRVRVMDFGLARLGEGERLTRTSTMMGTIGYLAPEVIRGEEPNAQSDIFSFGVVLYEMLSGRLPFRGAHEAALMYSVMHEEPVPLEKFRTDVPAELQDILLRALAKEREERYDNVAEMVADLVELVEGAESMAPRLRGSGRPERMSKRRAGAFAAGDHSLPGTPSLKTELRLFISSTVHDLHHEREHLIRKIFPEIRALCRQRGLTFTEIDLRWSLADDAAGAARAIRTSLEEIDRCRPYFIGVTGESYGWAPSPTDIYTDPTLLATYPWLEDAVAAGMSLSEIECRYAAIDVEGSDERPGACFYFREERRRPGEEPNDRDPRLTRLKEAIHARDLPVRTFRDPSMLGELIYDDLVEIIERDFSDRESLSPLARERRYHEAFAVSRRHAYIPNPDYLRHLDAHAESDGPPLLIRSASGSGKSALVAYWAVRYRRRNPDAFVVEHYCGIGEGSGDRHDIARHLAREIQARRGTISEIPDDPEALIASLPERFALLGEDRMVVVLDGVNQLPERDRDLSWLPSHLPPNLRLIVTSVDPLDGGVPDRNDWEKMEIDPLDRKAREAVVVRFAGEFHKEFSDDHVNRLASAAQSAQPLYLRTLLEELRLCGTGERLDRAIDRYLLAKTTDELFHLVLERLEEDFGRDPVREVMRFIGASRHGLSELELLDLTKLSRMQLSPLLHSLDYHLIEREGLYTFFHSYLSDAVEARYLESEFEKRKAHRELAEYFSAQDLDERRLAEEPWEWMQAEEWEKLLECVTDLPTFLALNTGDRKYELLAWWRSLNERCDVIAGYVKRLREREPDADDDPSNVLHELGETLTLAGRYPDAERMYRVALAQRKHLFGSEDSRTLDTMQGLAALYYHHGRRDRAEPLLRRALEITASAGERDLEREVLLANDLGAVLIAPDTLDEAEALFRRSLALLEKEFDSKDARLAEVLNNLGVILWQRKRYEEALHFFERALEVNQAKYGERHPDIAANLTNIGAMYSQLGLHEEAEQVGRRAVEINREIKGPDHIETLYCMANLVTNLKDLKKYYEAIDLISEVHAVRERILGSAHPMTMGSHRLLAHLLEKTGDYEKSYTHYRHVLGEQKRVLGPIHPDTVKTIENFLVLLRKMNREEEVRMIEGGLDVT